MTGVALRLETQYTMYLNCSCQNNTNITAIHGFIIIHTCTRLVHVHELYVKFQST